MTPRGRSQNAQLAKNMFFSLASIYIPISNDEEYDDGNNNDNDDSDDDIDERDVDEDVMLR